MDLSDVPKQNDGPVPSVKFDPIGSPGPNPAFLVGQDDEGHWLAVEAHGLGGGMFVSREAALGYVGFETGHDPRACHLSQEPIGFSFKVPVSRT